ncbi:uncharacterized protein LOC129780472 isoform X2 [Toxorhynchites rutilus septentrionalis]|uniref:uncharacterized protein LOC129780472 isoform X2 n=1 Tax=Toxorhynchites rutilus septentrionalis TaxID=329112 RepID=UPI002479EFD8|nr:uncharacterized protein LOC129780472 isoform X2 [Toxorhynchites rutilus septentrionalis]
MWITVRRKRIVQTLCYVFYFILIVTSDDLTPRNAYYHSSPKEQASSVIRIKNQIKRILNMQPDNATLDNYILSIFNVQNINPTYVFLLPSGDKKHIQKLIYQKSDFLEAQFPNISSINKFKRSLNYSLDEYRADKYTDQEMGTFASSDDDYTADDGLMDIVEENMRTERNFIQFMDDLNHGLEGSFRKQLLKQKNASSRKLQSTQSVGWDELGLEGWSGGLKAVTEQTLEQPLLQRPKTKSADREPFINIQANFDPLKFLRTPIPTRPVEIETTNGVGNGTFVPPRHKNPALLLSYDHEKKLEEIWNQTQTFSGKPVRLPITSSRDAHHDDDVFIARANNPFGHSTKWRWSNDTDETNNVIGESAPTREGRSKRGVYNLYSMIKCATGCDPIIYKGYGCYCGFLGSGQALDGIDRCCKMHDYCYTASNCPMFLEYFVPYLWKCYRGRPLCAHDHGEWGGVNSCAARLCRCDLSLSKCLRRYHCPHKRNVCTTSPLRLLQNLIMVY